MSTGSIVRNAGSHRILFALTEGFRTSKELKNIVGAINSISRFDGEYMARLIDSGLVERVGDLWRLTDAGSDRIAVLGPPEGYCKKKERGLPNYLEREVYDPKGDQPTYRPGALDHLKYPSRIGNKLFYRDGRVEEIKHGQH